MIHQLRVYEVFEHNKAAFLDRFANHSARIMRAHGFNIVAMWEAKTEARLEFIYLLSWPDAATKEAAWAAFLLDEEWIAIKRDTLAAYGRFVGEIEDRVLVPACNATSSTGTDVEGHQLP